MTDQLSSDSSHTTVQTPSIPSTNNGNTNIWMWIAAAELLIILILLNKRFKKNSISAKKKFKNESLEQDVDFNNIINSSFNSTQLYNQIKTKCHPDRFATDLEKNAIAERIFREITKNKNNVKRLLELKEEAETMLNIKFES
jgi:hypothetical protein